MPLILSYTSPPDFATHTERTSLSFTAKNKIGVRSEYKAELPYAAIRQNERQKEIKKLLNWPKGFPVSKTYTDAFAKCNHHELARVIAQVLVKARAVEQCDDEPSRLVAQQEPSTDRLIHTAGDGKILRGTLKHERE